MTRLEKGLVTAIGLAIAYLPLLLRSLWVDEAGTFWMSRGGPISAVAKTWHWPGQSLLFAALQSLFTLEGGPARDLILRLPALAGGVLLCYFLYRFAEDLIGPGAGKLAAILGAFHPMTIEFATQARPYSLAMAAVTASAWALHSWLRTNQRRWLAAWSLSAVLVVYLHYLFATVFLAQLVYLLWNRRTVRWGQFALGAVCALAAAAPLVPHLLLLVRESGTLPFMPPPTLRDLGDILLPTLLLCGLLATGLVLRNTTKSPQPRLAPGTLALLLIWWLAGPLLLYAVSTHSEMRMFVPRYLAYAAPAATLLLTAAGYAIFGPGRAVIWALAAALLTTGSPLNLTAIGKPGPEETGPFMALIRQESPETPVLFASELPESNAYDWKAGNSANSYLYAPFVAHPMPNRLVPLPHRVTDDAKAWLRAQLPADLNRHPKLVLITRDPAWIPAVAAELERYRYTYRWVQPNSFYVVRFEKGINGGK